jgi:hypothetical protein
MKWSIAAAVVLIVIAPVPALAGFVAGGITVVHAIPWALRSA